MKILFLVRSLGIGGAERQLVILAKGLHQQGHEVSVAVFYTNGPLEKELHEIGIPIFNLHKSGRWDVLPFFMRLVGIVGKWKPQTIYGFLGTPNILTVSLKPLFPRIRMVWGVRASNMDLDRYDWLSRASYRVESWLSRFADRIICNSRAGLGYAAAHGFPRKKMTVIPNGIDIERFHPDTAARERVRNEWGAAGNEILIGLAARLDPMKDHPSFLRAVEMLARERPGVRFVCVGDGPESYKAELHRLATDLGLDEKLIWAGARSDMPAVYSALDIAISSSYGEGFSNTIAEAMACGVPCVVTDVGDSARIVGDSGSVVPPRDHNALAAAIQHLIDLPVAERRELGAACRARVVSEFGIDRLIQRTEQVLGLV